MDTIPENGERRKSGELGRFRSGFDLLSGHHRGADKTGLTGKSGVKKLLPLNRNITTIPEDLHTQSLSED